jgi:hypothetical protein
MIINNPMLSRWFQILLLVFMISSSIATAVYLLHLLLVALLTEHSNHLLYPTITREPYLHKAIDDNMPTTVFHAGDVFYVHTEVSRQVICSVDLNYRIITDQTREDGIHRVVYYTYPQTRTVVPPDTYYSDVRLVIPDWLKPGDYFIDRNASYVCQGLKIEVAKPLPLQIVDK